MTEEPVAQVVDTSGVEVELQPAVAATENITSSTNTRNSLSNNEAEQVPEVIDNNIDCPPQTISDTMAALSHDASEGSEQDVQIPVEETATVHLGKEVDDLYPMQDRSIRNELRLTHSEQEIQEVEKMLSKDIMLPSDRDSYVRTLHMRIKHHLQKQKEHEEKNPVQTITENVGKFKELLAKVSVWCTGKPPTRVYTLKQEDMRTVKSVIIDLLYALLCFGMPVYRAESHCTIICTCYGINCFIDATQFGFSITFANTFDDDNAETRYVKIKSNTVDLNKLCLLDDIADDIAQGKISISDARDRIRNVINAPGLYDHPIFLFFSFTLCSVIFSILINSLWTEVLGSLATGLSISITIFIISKFFPSLRHVRDVICAIIAGLVALALRAIFSTGKLPFNVTQVTLCGIISLLPGFSITVAITEITSRQFKGGALRFLAACTTAVQLAAGMMIVKIIENSSNLPEFSRGSFTFPVWAHAIVLPSCMIAFMLQFNAPRYPLAIFFVIMNGYFAFFVTKYIGIYMKTYIGALIGAFCVQTISKVYGWLGGHPPSVVTSCTILLMTPGSLTVKGLNALIEYDTVGGTTLLITVGQTAVALCFGLIAANFSLAWMRHKHEATPLRKLVERVKKMHDANMGKIRVYSGIDISENSSV